MSKLGDHNTNHPPRRSNVRTNSNVRTLRQPQRLPDEANQSTPDHERACAGNRRGARKRVSSAESRKPKQLDPIWKSWLDNVIIPNLFDEYMRRKSLQKRNDRE